MKYAVAVSLIIVIAAGIVFALTRPNPATDNRPVVGATIGVVADIVRQIAGDTVRVVQIVPDGASPHTFEVTPSVVADLADADIIFSIGHGLDGWTADIAAAVSGTKVIAVDESIQFRTLAFADVDAGETAGATDPHYWLSPENGKRIVAKVAWELMVRYDVNGQLYDANQDTLYLQIDRVAGEIRTMLEPAKGSSIVLFHESVGYFTDAFGLKIAGVFEPSPGQEPTPQQLADLQKTVRDHEVRAVFSEPQLPDAVVQSFVQDLNVKTGVLDPYGGAASGTTYQDLLLYNANVLAEALR